MKARQIVYLPINEVVPDPNQPRQYFDAVKLASLSSSIKQIGIKEPLSVAKQGGKYLLVDGERRYRAAKEVGLKEVPVIIEEHRDELSRRIEQFHLQEQHEGWKPIEKAIAIRDIAMQMNSSMQEVGRLLGIHRRVVEDYIAFIGLVSYKEMQKSEVPLMFAKPLAAVSRVMVREVLRQEDRDVSPSEVKEFQINLLKRIKAGEISLPAHLAKLRDSLVQDSKKTLKEIKNTSRSLEKIFTDTNGKKSALIRKLRNSVVSMSFCLNEFSRDPKLAEIIKDDPLFVSGIRSMVKRSQDQFLT